MEKYRGLNKLNYSRNYLSYVQQDILIWDDCTHFLCSKNALRSNIIFSNECGPIYVWNQRTAPSERDSDITGGCIISGEMLSHLMINFYTAWMRHNHSSTSDKCTVWYIYTEHGHRNLRKKYRRFSSNHFSSSWH